MTIHDATIGPKASQIALNISGVGDNVVVAGAPGKLIKVLQFFFVMTAAETITYKSSGIPLSGPMSFTANMSHVQDFIQLPLTCVNPGDSFIINLAAGSQLCGTLWFDIL
jgi:hypothetical protein